MLLALGRPDTAIVELEKLTSPRDAEAPRYLFAWPRACQAGHRTWDQVATEGRQLALEHGQNDLRGIARDLAALK